MCCSSDGVWLLHTVHRWSQVQVQCTGLFRRSNKPHSTITNHPKTINDMHTPPSHFRTVNHHVKCDVDVKKTKPQTADKVSKIKRLIIYNNNDLISNNYSIVNSVYALRSWWWWLCQWGSAMERETCVCATSCSIFANVSTLHPVPALTLMYTLCIMYDLTDIYELCTCAVCCPEIVFPLFTITWDNAGFSFEIKWHNYTDIRKQTHTHTSNMASLLSPNH